MGKSAISSSIQPHHHHQQPQHSQQTNQQQSSQQQSIQHNNQYHSYSHIKSPKIKDNTLSTLSQSGNDDNRFLFSNLNQNNNNTNNNNTNNNNTHPTYTLSSSKNPPYPHQSSFSAPPYNSNFNTMMNYPHNQQPQHPTSINPNSTTNQQFQQFQSHLLTPQQQHQQNQQHQQQQQQPQQYMQQPMRSRGDSIVLPPPIRSQGNGDHYYDTTSNTGGNTINPMISTSRSNSIFSSLINIPGSNGNSISEPSVTNPGSLSSKGDVASAGSGFTKSAASSSSGAQAPQLPPTSRSRQMSLIPSQDITVEDLENFLNKESMSNIFNWQNDPKMSIGGGGNLGGMKSKGNSLDLTNWNNDNSNNSITELLQSMISNGSIDFNSFSNMSDKQRRDSILKIINDQNTLRSQRSSSDQSRGANLREDMFDKKKQQQLQQQQQQQQQQVQQQSNQQLGSNQHRNSPQPRKSPQQQQQRQPPTPQQKQRQMSNTLSVPRDKDNVSPTSSTNPSPKFHEEPQSPKASPVFYNNMRINEPFTGNLYQPQASQQQQRSQQQQQQQPQQQQQRVFQNYPVSPQNQYQYSSYPNYNSFGYSNVQQPQQAQQQQSMQQQQQFPGNRNNSFGNYIYPMQTQQPPQYYTQQLGVSQIPQQYIPPTVTTKPPGMLAQQQQQQTQQQQQQLKSPLQNQQKPPVKRTRRSRRDSSNTSVASNASLATSAKNLGSPNSNRNLVPAQQFAQSEDGRPLLGATKIDQLMLVIQARDKGITNPIEQAADGSILASPDNFGLGRSKAELDSGVLPRPVSLVGGVDKPHKREEDEDDDDMEGDANDIEGSHHPHHHKKRKHKNQQCPYCFKYFTQTTHLEVHIRSHIGYKPFECSYCHKKFTQGGNLRTHLRLHTGEKPFTCEICNRSFNRKGNLAAHKLTHENLKPYECKLDNCDKSFTQLGNLKSHQNRFHLEKLNELTHKLAELRGPMLNSLPPDEKELLEYFKDLYKNSNKGIRGRGKSHKDGEGEGDDKSGGSKRSGSDASSEGNNPNTTTGSSNGLGYGNEQLGGQFQT
ncbi:AZF1 Asparagine-rich zinc finger protein AZF1 [Candida maltosa Xu316]